MKNESELKNVTNPEIYIACDSTTTDRKIEAKMKEMAKEEGEEANITKGMKQETKRSQPTLPKKGIAINVVLKK